MHPSLRRIPAASRAAIALLLLTAACGDSDTNSTDSDGLDAGAIGDAGGSSDAGGSNRDGGGNQDGGSEGDAQSAADGSADSDSGTIDTDAAAGIGPAPVSLGAAGSYTILAKSAISNVPTSAVTGNLGLSPAAASYITGFALTKAGTHWTSPQVVGRVFAADNDPPTPNNLTTAISDMQTAYTDAAGRPTPAFLNLGAGTLSGLTLAPGLYKWSTSVNVPTDLTIAGAPNDVWIFQISGDLTMSAAKSMTLSGGARARNIVWQVAGTVVLGTQAHAEGIVLSKTAIKLGTGASINGRLMAQTAVDIAGSTVTAPAL